MVAAPSLVLGYHRVVPDARDPYGICVQPAHFAAHLDAIDRVADVVPLDELDRAGRGHRRRGARPQVAITFDDGYADNAEVAAPMLRAHGHAATVFVATGDLDGGSEFWWDRLEHLLLDDPPADVPFISLSIAGRPLRVDVRTEAGRRRAVLAVNLRLNGLPMADIDATLDALQEQLGVDADLAGCRAHRRLTADGVREMVAGGLLDVGGHTRTHTALSALDPTRQRDEIAGCRDDLATLVGRRATSFAYPFGVPSTFTDDTPRIVRASGFTRAFTTSRGRLTRFGDRYRAPRYMVSDWDGATFEETLAWWLAA